MMDDAAAVSASAFFYPSSPSNMCIVYVPRGRNSASV